jgi:hypothetical protein
LIVTLDVYRYAGSHKDGIVNCGLWLPRIQEMVYFYEEWQMRKQKPILSLFGSVLILLFGCQIWSSQAFGEPGDNPEMAAASSPNSMAAASPAIPTAATLANEINEMKELINIQRRQIEKLQSTVDRQQQELNQAVHAMAANNAPAIASAAMTASPAPAARPASDQEKVSDAEIMKGELEAMADSTAQTNQRVTKLETDTAANKKDTDAKAKQLGNFNFSGDIRIRYEPFFQEGAPDRNRERFRLRFNVTGKVSDEFSGGFSLATGTLDDPVSTNQTFTGFFNRKNFGVDKAFITYKPNYAKFLKLDAGKFAFPWYRTPMTFDSDVNPEGFAQTLSFDIKSSALKNITFVGFQLPINEVSGGSDSFILGGQVQMQFRLSSKARLAIYGAGINFLRTDPLGVAAAARTSGVLVGSLNNFNTLRRNSSGTVIGYAYKFAYLDAIMKLDLDTNPRFPTSILFNFVNNTRGPKERSGYWTELLVGKQKEAKDLQFGYSFIRIEKDAVISAFNESDLRASTNVIDHKLQGAYMFKSNFTGQFTAWIGKLANPLYNVDQVPAGVRSACTGANVSNCRDPYLKRLQFDLIYKF